MLSSKQEAHEVFHFISWKLEKNFMTQVPRSIDDSLGLKTLHATLGFFKLLPVGLNTKPQPKLSGSSSSETKILLWYAKIAF